MTNGEKTESPRPRRRRPESITSAALAENALAFLRDPARILVAVEESLEDQGTEIERTVRARLNLHTDESIFIAQKPKKGVLVSVSADHEQGPTRVERLSHNEHKQVEQWLIFYRFWSWWQTIDTDPGNMETISRLNPIILRKILSIPLMKEELAHEVIWEVFGVSVAGGERIKNTGDFLVKRLKFGRGSQDAVASAHYDQGQYENLVRLCIELASRYYVAFRIRYVDEKYAGDVYFTYRYRQHYRIKWGGLLGRARSRHGGAPPAIRVHTPLARMTDHYSVSMPAKEGYYFSAQNVLLQDSIHKGATTKDFAGRNSTKETLKVADNFWREIAGGSIAHLHVDASDKAAAKFFVGLELAERPPGSEGRAYGVVRVALFATLLLCIWKYANPESAPVAALLASLLTIGGLAVQSSSVEIPLYEAPAVPRWIIFIQAHLSILFAVWLLTTPPIQYRHPSMWNSFCYLWATYAGAAIVIVLFAMLIVTRTRVSRAQSYYERAVLNRQHDKKLLQNNGRQG